MYRISIRKPQKIVKPTAPGAFTFGYFGPCFKEDVMSPEQIAFFNDRSQWKYISSYIKDNAKLRELLKEAGVGSSVSWSNFRHNTKYALVMCQKGENSKPSYVHFLRPEYAQSLGLSGPIVIDIWRAIDKKSQDLIKENYIPDQRDYTSIRGDVVKVAYTGNVSALTDYQNNLISQGFSSPFSVNVWGRFLEGNKELKLYLVDRRLREIAKNKSLTPEEKQQKFNQALEESFYGLKEGEKLYKYVGDDKSPEANLEVEHNGKGKTRKITEEGFTLDEWKRLVLKKEELPSVFNETTNDEEKTRLLNGLVGNFDRFESQPKIKYTGNDPHTLRKMELTGLFPNVFYSQKEWYDSLAKVEHTEKIKKPYNDELQKKTKTPLSEFPLYREYENELENLNSYKQLSSDEIIKLRYKVGQLFRKRLERTGSKELRDSLVEIKNNPDKTAIQQFLYDLQELDNSLIENCYTKQTGSLGEITLRRAFSQGLGPDLKYKSSLSINTIPPGSQESMLMIFDGAILKSNNIVMLFEIQGPQHYSYNQRHYKDYDRFQDRLYRDKIKSDFCRQNNIPLFTISHILSQKEATEIYNNIKNSGVLKSFIPKGTVDDYNYKQLQDEPLNFNWVDQYVDNLVLNHFRPIMNTEFYIGLTDKINRIMNDLSKLVMIAISNQYDSQMKDTSFIQGFSKQTLLDEGHKKLVDSFNKYFGEKFYMDYQDNVTYKGQILKPKEEQPKPVQEMAFKRHKKKRYKIRRIK
jgi:hypothetical protein